MEAVAAAGAAKGEDKPVDSLKFYNDKGGWKDAFTQVGAASKKDIGVGMEPVGYSDSNTYTAFIRSSFRTKKKADLFTWHTGESLKELVDENLVAETTDLWTKAIDEGCDPGAAQAVHLRRQAVLRAREHRLLGDVLQQGRLQEGRVTADPTTWDELVAVADKLKAAGITPYYQTNILFTFDWFQQLVAGTDPDLYEGLATGEVKYTDPEVVEIMNVWKKMIDAATSATRARRPSRSRS